GIGIILSFNSHDYKEMIKMVMSVQFYLVQTFLYTYAGDILQDRSESIIYAIYSSTWHEMSPIMVKDLIFIMMRMKIPLRISAGKFFYLARTTMTDLLKTTLSYISFLQVTL
ncbi:Odorant receptor 47a, partial [Camponotus floridanus]